MSRKWYGVKASTANTPAVISIFDEIGMWGVTAKDFIAEFRAIPDNDITLEINTPGGSVFDGLAMYSAMKMSGKNITVVVMGIAASMGSYLAMIGSKISMPENTFMMLHHPLNAVIGDADEMREMADILDKIGASMITTYAARTGKTADEIDALLASDAYLTADECLAMGLCDEVTPAVTATAKFEHEHMPANIQALFTPAADPEPPVVDIVPAAEDESTVAAIMSAINLAGMQAYSSGIVIACVTVAEATARIKVIGEVTALCEAVGKTDMLAAMVAAGASMDDARAQIGAALAKGDEHIDTTLSLSNDPLTNGVQPTVLDPAAIWAARRNHNGVK
jgi:ATP-dependent Clp endopeptidase proteolytic subunit ClpP